MRLPALPQVAFGWRFVSALLGAALSLLLYHLWNSPAYRVGSPQVMGLQRISSKDVSAIMNVNNEPVFALDVNELRNRLEEAFPEFSSVAVEVSLPSDVLVTVQERQPILAWRQDNRTVLVDANGVAFPLRAEQDTIPSLVVEAFDTPPTAVMDIDPTAPVQLIPVEMVSAILSLSAYAPADRPLVYDRQRGLGWQDEQGWEVYFGDVRDMNTKLHVYQAVVKKLQSEGITPALISVEHVQIPYYRLDR